MQPIRRLLTNLCTDDLAASKHFYTSLFGLVIAFDSDWFVHLRADGGALEVGLISPTHSIVPPAAQGATGGMYLTFVVDDVDAVFAEAQAQGFTVLSPPDDTFYGQRRLLLHAPEGTVVDVSAPLAPMKN